MFDILFESADYLVSFFYNFMFLNYGNAIDFLKGSYTFEFTSLIVAEDLSFILPNIPIVDRILDMIIDLFSLLFMPLDIFVVSDYNFTPFYLCFISFLVRGVFILGFLKLISFVIELLPFE